MGRGASRVCDYCGRRFRQRSPRQIYCGRPECRSRRRRAYMKSYMARWKRRHPDYWKTERQYDYLRRWRRSHPDYFDRWRRGKNARRGRRPPAG